MRELVIDGRRIADDTACFVIAEIGHNHQGSVERASELFRAAKRGGRRRGQAPEARQPAALHARALRQPVRQREQLRRRRTASTARRSSSTATRTSSCGTSRASLGLVFFATAFDEASADLLDELDVPAYKIASGDLTNTPLLRHVAVVRQAAHRLDGRRDARGRRPRGRRDHAVSRNALPAPVHGRLPGGGRGAEPRRDHDPARAVPRARGRALRPPGRDRDGAGRLHARRARDREALHARATPRRAPTTRSR